MTIIISAINAHGYIKILDPFLISLIENWFSEDEVIFQDDNASCHKVKGIKAFHQEKRIKINGIFCKQLYLYTNKNFGRNFLNGPSEGSIHQRRFINCLSGNLEPFW